MPTALEELWTSRGWRREAETWIQASVTAAGHEVTGPVEQVRVRVWSTQLTVPTTAGLLWFKENHPGQSTEAALVAELATIAPDHVVVPLAVDRSRGWLLTPDHGQTLATLPQMGVETWCRVVAEFAELQRRVEGHRDRVLSLGLTRLTPAAVADHVRSETERVRRLPPSDAAHVAPELAGRVLAAVPDIQAIAEELADAAPPLASLEHNDLHQNNVFIPRADEATLRFFDFGDAVWAHPFTTLAVPVASLSREWETRPDDPRIRRVVDSYLEVWSDIAAPAELREAARLAQLLSPVHRQESWRRLLEGTPRDQVPEHAENLTYWVERVAEIGAE